MFPAIPHLARGGIVTTPTVAVVGDRGPEAVVPLTGAAGVGTTIVNVAPGNNLGDYWSQRQFARVLSDAVVGSVELERKVGAV